MNTSPSIIGTKSEEAVSEGSAGEKIELLFKPSKAPSGPKDVTLRVHAPDGGRKFTGNKSPCHKDSITLFHTAFQGGTNLLEKAVDVKKPENNEYHPKGEGSNIWRNRRKKLAIFCKKVLGFLLSTMGLFILLVSYTIFGGWIFNMVESPKEVRTKHSVRDSLRQHVDLLWNTTEQLNILHKENWSEMALTIVENYTRVVYLATKNDGWDGKNDGEADLQWSFAGSLLYSITVITTIGYGHIAPKTELGRIITIFYATFGIPLTLLSITHVGGFMATVFRFLYKNIFCGLCCVCFRCVRRHGASRQQKESVVSLRSKNKFCSCWKKQLNNNQLNTPIKESLLNSKLDEQSNATKILRTTAAAKKLRHSYKIMVKWRRGIHNALFTENNRNIQVPIHVSLILIGGYIALGALLFGLWEKEWNFLIGCYFCFITLSTIGFGDFVPGTSLDPSSSQEKLVLCSLYLIIGLALLAMCFDLMQEEARCIFRSVGEKLGLVQNERNLNDRGKVKLTDNSDVKELDAG